MKLSLEDVVAELKVSQEYFNRSTKNFVEADASFAPAVGSMTVAGQIAHVAQTIDWFLHGAFSAEGFNLDFAKHAEEIAKVTTLASAREWVTEAYARLFDRLSTLDEAEWEAPIAPGLVMGGEPRKSILFGVIEHTAHHRGALTVYSRMLGKTSPLPYMDIPT